MCVALGIARWSSSRRGRRANALPVNQISRGWGASMARQRADRLRQLQSARCALCGIALPTGLMVPDGGQACADIRWYCKDVKSWNGGRPGRRGSVTSPRLPPSASRGQVPSLIRCQLMILCQPNCLALPTRHSPLLSGSSLRLPVLRCAHIKLTRPFFRWIFTVAGRRLTYPDMPSDRRMPVGSSNRLPVRLPEMSFTWKVIGFSNEKPLLLHQYRVGSAPMDVSGRGQEGLIACQSL
jgi:hypothetical protein